ncbi:InlB B-repeat-containing protein [Bifidobacterium pseudolongum subsp. globosum]|uniref:InlB B-repeat-containing protein n=1 Tax=Bifidobacterium pseudolongum TaxID=1694 RepID=UPI003996777F
MSVEKRMRRYLVACLSAIIAVALAVVPFAGSASATETKVALNAANFPDPEFREYIANLADVDKNGYLDQEECNDVNTIDEPFFSNWSSVQGIAYFPNLKELDLRSDYITSLNLENNEKLEHIFIGSPVKKLDLSKNESLIWLMITDENFQEVILPEEGQLIVGVFPNTSLSSLKWPANSHVVEFDISGTPIIAASLPQGQFDSMTKVSPLKAKRIEYNPSEGSYDLKKIVPWFDGSKVSNVRGAAMNGSVVSGLKGEVTVKYNYATGMGDIKPVIIFTPQVLPQSADEVEVTVIEGQQPALPSSVNVRYTDGSVKPVPVIWDSHNWATQKPGTVALSGTVSGTTLKTTAVVTIMQRPYNVIFDSNGGSSVGPAAVEAGQPATEPTAPARTGYAFAGWYTAKDGGDKYDFTKPVTADMTLYAQWTINKYAVTFDTNGGTAVAPVTVEHGQKISQPANPTRTGYTFAGWYTAKAGGSKYNFDVSVIADMTLYAQWTVNKYTVTFDTNGGTAVAAATVNYGQKVSQPAAPTRTGYTFTGWHTTKTGGTKYDFTKPVTADMTLYAQWAINKYTVTFDSNGGTVVAAATVEHGQKVSQPANPTRTGYTFNGWYTAKDGGSKYDFTKPVTTDMTMYARWTINKYIVTFDSNGGTVVKATTVDYGQKVSQPAAPSRTGYAFNGWYTAKTGGSKYDFAKPVTANITLYARWTINKYTVTFDANGGTAVAAATVEHGQKVSQPANPTRTGYTFNGWYTAKAGGSKFNFDTTITADMTLYAQWTINKYTVTFDTNGGSTVNPLIAEHGKTVSKPADPTRTNYTFTGWYTAKTGGAKFDFAKPITSNVTVFAQWQPRIVFRDVNNMTPHREDIVWLADNGISTGWLMPDGTYEFRGMDTVKRQDMAAFLRRLAAKYGIAGAKDFQPVAADWKRFKDVNSKTPHAEDILWLAKSGISTGWQETDGSWTFRGMDTVKRQDMAAFLYRLADRAGKASGVTPKTDFTDVTDGTPHYKDVQWLGGSGISQGYRNANGSWRFEGMTSVYRQDMAAFLHRLNNRLAQ